MKHGYPRIYLNVRKFRSIHRQLKEFSIHVPTTSYEINLHILSFQLLIGTKRLLLALYMTD
jgi:hypothetical protein